MKCTLVMLATFASSAVFCAVGINAQLIDASRVATAAMSHDEWATQVLYTPSGKEIVSCGADGRIVIWDAASGKVIREVVIPSIVTTMGMSSDGTTVAAGDATGKVSFVDVGSGQIKAG